MKTIQVRVLIVLMSISSLSFFIVFPYLVLYLRSYFFLTNTESGTIVGCIALVSACGAWVGGSIIDRFGWLNILRLSSLFYVFVFIFLYFTNNLSTTICLIVGIGLCRLLMEPAIKTAIVIHDDGAGKLFKVRYMTLVGGAAVGPILSTLTYPYGTKFSFIIAAALLLLFMLLTTMLKEQKNMIDHEVNKVPLSINRISITSLITIGFCFSWFFLNLKLRLH